MFNKLKQINYWKENSVSDLEIAEILISKNKLKEGLFFCHLSIEKVLKALYVDKQNKIPPRTHNLLYLLNKLEENLGKSENEFIGVLMKYQIEGRYPDYNPEIPSKDKVLYYLKKSKEIQQWILNKLKK